MYNISGYTAGIGQTMCNSYNLSAEIIKNNLDKTDCRKETKRVVIPYYK